MKGIEFLKKIGHIEEDMISEAASPVKKSRKWNGNMIKFAGLAACIAVFVGAICVSRMGLSLKKNGESMSSAEPDSQEKTSINISETLDAAEKQKESAACQDEAASMRMVMIQGRIYVDAGESDINGRCGTMDGSIDSSVESGRYPEKDNQSNFGSGYGYQYVGEDSIDVDIDGQWIRFEAIGSQNKEEPSGQNDTHPLDVKEPDITEAYTEPYTEPYTEQGQTVKPVRYAVSLDTGTLTAEGAKFLIINLGTKDANTGTDFHIEKLENGSWLECDYINDEIAWAEIALILEPEKERVFYADWSKIYGSLEKGTYRFRKTIFGDGDSQEIYCSFTL